MTPPALPPPLPPPLPRRWRPLRARLVTIPFAVAVAAADCLVAALLPPPWTVGDRVGLSVLGVLIASVLLLLARPLLSADERGLVVRNLLSTRRLAWAEVISIGVGRDDSWAFIDVTDGSALPVMALQVVDARRTKRALDEVRALLAARESGPP